MLKAGDYHGTLRSVAAAGFCLGLGFVPQALSPEPTLQPKPVLQSVAGVASQSCTCKP